MQSLKSKIFNAMIRHRHLFQGKLRKERFDENTSIIDFRILCEKSAARYSKLPKDVEIKAEVLSGIKAEWLIPKGADPQKVILYVHGGGYVSGSCDDHKGFVATFAKSCGVTNLVYEYRLAPEHPFPAAVNDSIAVYKSLLEKGIKPRNIIIAGESAGGGLTLTTLLALKEYNVSLPAAAIAISPWIDLTCTNVSYKTKNKMSVAPLDSWLVFSKYYIGDNHAENSLISPIYGDLCGLPPIFINSGEDDELYDDAELFYKKAKSAGVDITFRGGAGMVHCYPLMAPMFREATEAMKEICDFIEKHLKNNTTSIPARHPK